MKLFENFLPVLTLAFSLVGQEPVKTFESTMINRDKPFGSQVALSYSGSVKSSGMNQLIGIVVDIDTTVGVRYEVVMGSNSHIAIFYKFSDPHQTVLYNFNTHKSKVIKPDGPADSDPNVDVIGTETVNAYSCTHLQHGGGTDEVSDYWMTPKLPGFSKLVNTLKKIDINLPAQAFSGTIFNWGGLVKWTVHFIDKQNGQTVDLELHLRDANTNVRLPAKWFDVPSK
jgi:hypothetical protein